MSERERRSELRSAGHWYGGKLARDLIPDLERGVSAGGQVAERVEAVIAERSAALRALGADDDDVEAWVSAFHKSLRSKIDASARRSERGLHHAAGSPQTSQGVQLTTKRLMHPHAIGPKT